MMIMKTVILKSKKRVAGALVLPMLLAGCAPQKPVPVAPVAKPSASVLLQQKRAHLQRVLKAEGVQILQVGKTVTLVLEADDLFHARSANVRIAYTPVLNHVIAFLRTYSLGQVSVAAYTNHFGTGAENTALSKQQAQVVGDILLNGGAGASFIGTQGEGAAHPVANPTTDGGASLNRRVEIHFHYFETKGFVA